MPIATTQPRTKAGRNIPAEIGGLSLWFDAADLALSYANGDSVTNWDDKSFNRIRVSQSGTNRPTFVTNAYNGLPCVRFASASSQSLACAADEPQIDTCLVNNANTFFAVVNNTTDAATYHTIFSKFSVYGTIFGLRKASSSHYPDVYNISFGLSARSYRANTAIDGAAAVIVYTLVNPSGTYQPYVNGTATATTETAAGLGTYLDNSNVFKIGAYAAAPTDFFNGDIMECGMYNRVLDAGSRSLLVDYLGKKWGITTT